MFTFLINFLFPKKCFGCKGAGSYFCEKCMQKQERVIMSLIEVKSSVDKVVTLFKYKGIVKKGLLITKYNFSYSILDELVEKSIRELGKRRVEIDADLIIPVPLYKSRERWRGFNQSTIIAKALSIKLNMPLDEKLLLRVKATRPQATLSRSERLRNTRGIFAVNSKVKRTLANKKVLLVDDVWTTGATLNEAARVCKLAGATEVWGFTIAR